ncbi:polysaccharide biosynthesis tyrosine autokinase [Mucilaginibacter sp. 14171R-50]|uniref:GumC family protein n=1 Tax=Mucilaginibacter sp. 14171R-50 TaxID=2703789 RepID=UPI00138B3BD0|nr:tyrosine-protein kinase family protein [Mucilaginibacter sp. 14171R-50]QHS54280.1 polysaccharide biosynthesis tyrosine autokinase [Mucilaginibacter sp. 14171R-50]
MNANTDTNFDNDNIGELNLREIIFKYLHYSKLILFSLVFFLVLGYVYIKFQTPQYQIETDLLIKDKSSNGPQDDILKGLDLFSSDKIIDNEVQILKSATLMEKVVRALKLDVSYFESEGVRKSSLYSNSLPFQAQLINPNELSYKDGYPVVLNENGFETGGKTYPYNKPVQCEFGQIIITSKGISPEFLHKKIYIVFQKIDAVVQRYRNQLSINPVSKEGTVLIITLQDAVPKRGKDILNRLIFEYNNAAIQDKNKVTSSTLNFITDRLRNLSQELGTAEKNVENYKSQNRITDISAQSQVFIQSTQQNDAELSKVNIQLSVLNNLQNYINSSKDLSGVLPSMLGIEDPTLLGLVSQLSESQLKKQSLLQTIPETNPIVTSLNDQIRSIKAGIDQSVKNLKAGLLITKQQLQEKNSKFESVITQVPGKERGLIDVMRQQEIKNNLFTFLLQKREEQEMALASTMADSRTIDEARSSQAPVKPVKPLIMLIFFFLGLIVPAGYIYLKEVLNNKVSKKADIEKMTRVPVVAEIGHSEQSTPLIVVDKPRSMVAEQIRALRTNLQFISSGVDHKVLLFTSSISGEGKSFISLNLGASLAMSGKRVVILELDLRKPKLNAVLEIDNSKGLSNYLISTFSYKEIISNIPGQENYYIITSGPIPPNPAELLTNGRIQTLIEELKADFDYVIIDAPPVGLVTDAQILGEYANATMFIIRHNYTFKSQIGMIDQLSKTGKLPQINIIFNSIDYTSSGYGYGYGYGYSYGGGYYQEDKPSKKSKLKNFFR